MNACGPAAAQSRIGITTYLAPSASAAVTRQLLFESVSAMFTREVSMTDKASSK